MLPLLSLKKTSFLAIIFLVILLITLFFNGAAPAPNDLIQSHGGDLQTSDLIVNKVQKKEVIDSKIDLSRSDTKSVLVKFLPSVNIKDHPILRTMGVSGVNTYTRVGNISQLIFDTDQNIPDTIQRLLDTRLVEYVEPNYIVYADSANSSQLPWNLHNTGVSGGVNDADIDAPEAWAELSRQSDIASDSTVIAILDTGIDVSHPSVEKHLWVNAREISENDKDDDNKGFIDDAVGLHTCGRSSTWSDDNGHGTQVASVISSLNPHHSPTLLSIKTLCDDGRGYHANAIAALDYVLRLREQGVNISVVNLSWGGESNGRYLEQALKAVAQENIVIVASAGNLARDNDTTPHYPSAYDIPEIIAVASSNNKDQLASSSNYGQLSVDLIAPGVDIKTADINGGYQLSSGTSLASAHVAGTVAMVQMLSPRLSATQVKSKIIASADQRKQFAGKVTSGARLNAGNIFPNLPNQLVSSSPSRIPSNGGGVLPSKLANASLDEFGLITQNTVSHSAKDNVAPPALEVDIVANQVMMSFTDEFRTRPLADRQSLLAPYGVTIIKEFPYAGGSVLLEILGVPSAKAGELPEGETKETVYQRVNEIIEKLQQSGFVGYAEPDQIVQANVAPNDPRYDELWGLEKIQAEQAWDYIELDNPNPSPVIIGVIDTGIDYNHPDLAANMWVNTAEIAGNGIDDDSNGYVDDVYGWDAANNDGDPMDDQYHGTHVAGTIGAVRNNSEGVAGVTPYVRLMALKFLNSTGIGFTSDAIELLNYIHYMKQERGVDIRLTNNSWGGGGDNQSLRSAISASNDFGILFVAAAGNDAENIDNLPHYPSSYDIDNVISVAATDRNDLLASFSNYGGSVDIAAPGKSILSTYPNNEYNSISGTSMAAPHVSGALGLLLSSDPSFTVLDAKNQIINSADTLPSLIDKTSTAARINVYAAVSAPPIFETDLARGILNLAEGSSSIVNVRLNTQPETATPLTVTVTRQSGDTDIIITSGAVLTFDQSNWDQWQPLHITAQEDPDISNDSAVFEISSTGLSSKTFIVQETDNLQLSANICESVTEISVSECEGLVALYAATGGGNWINNDGWAATATPCSWFGVFCFDSSVYSIYLYNNNLSGEIPPAISTFTQLQFLDLSFNQLTGSIPSEIDGLISLTSLSLSDNQLQGTIPPEIGNLVNLNHIGFRNNQLSGSIPSEIGNISGLTSLYLDYNQLDGEIPSVLGNLTNLNNIGLNNNQFSGSIPSELGQLLNLFYFDLSNNQLTGSIPAEIGNIVNLFGVFLDNNQLSGAIPPEIGNLVNLFSLSIANNQLTGPLPSELGNLSNLNSLILSRNQLTGTIPPELGSLTNLYNLFLSQNQLTGNIPPELGQLTNLYSLGLQDNNLTGAIPNELGNLTIINNIYLSQNALTSSIPEELGQLINIRRLDLYENQLSGNIPASLGQLTNLTRLYLYENQLTGPIPPELGNLESAFRFSIRNNQLTGTIPPELGNLANLDRLYLYGNQLTGSIPPELGNINRLDRLYLHNNQLSGDIPSELDNLTRLTQFLVNNNRLTGDISENISEASRVEVSYNSFEVDDPTVIANLNLRDPDWQNTQTVAPDNLNLMLVDGELTLSWTPINYTADNGSYIISSSSSINGPFIEHGRTVNKSSNAYTILNGTEDLTRFYVVQSQTAAHGDQQSTLISSYSLPAQYDSSSTVPVILLPSALVLDASDASGIDSNYPLISQFLASVSAVDSANNPLEVSNDIPTVFPVGATVVTFEACDISNNCVTASQTVTVRYDAAFPAPVVTAPADIVIEATSLTTPVAIGLAIATDVVDGSLIAVPDQAGPFSVGVHRIIWSATNSSNKTSVAEQIVTVQDTTAPEVIAPADITIEATALLTPVSLGVATAEDRVDGVLTPVASKTGSFALGFHTVTWRVTDNAGNEGIATQQVYVIDTTAPQLTVPAHISATAGTVVSIGQATSDDIFPVFISNNAPLDFPLGTTVVTWTASDTSGNYSSADQVVVVNPYYPNHSGQLACIPGDSAQSVWIVNPDNSTLSVIEKRVDGSTETTRTFNDAVNHRQGKPTSITKVNNYMAVTYSDLDQIRHYRLDNATGLLPYASWISGHVTHFNEGDQPVASVSHGNDLYVALYGSGEIAKINATSREIISRLYVGPKPKAMALTSDGSRLLVTRFISTSEYGEVYDIDTAGDMSFRDTEQPSIKINKIWVPDDIDHGSGVPNYLRSIVIDPNDSFAYITANKANIDSGTYLSGQPLSGDNTVRAMIATIDLNQNRDINIDGETREGTLDIQNASDPSATTLLPDGKTGAYALQGNNRITFIDLYGDSIVDINVGAAPQSMCATSDTLYVKNYADRTVSIIDIEPYLQFGSIYLSGYQSTTVERSDELLSVDELIGLQLFYSAAHSELSPQGYMSCASCHDDGGHDGMTWDFTHMGEGLRNTISLRGSSGNRFGVLNWSANADEVQDIEKQLEQLSGGNGLIPGVTFIGQSPLAHVTSGSSYDLDALSAYISSLGEASVMRSPEQCDLFDIACWSRHWNGSWQFEAYGCTDCHARESYRSGTFRDGLAHDMGTITETSGQRLGGTLSAIRTPTLIELWDSAPYLHDGSAETLEDVMNTGAHASYGLTESEMTNLIQYLKTIDRSQYIHDDTLVSP